MQNVLSLLLAAALACLLVAACGYRAIDLLSRLCRERIDTASAKLAALHAAKSGTPSMGGLLIFGAWLLAVALCCDLHQNAVLIVLVTACAFLGLGACDDLLKARGLRRGLTARTKLIGQLAISVAAVLAVLSLNAVTEPCTWLIYVPLASLFIAGMSNAVNLTDGLDGLAAGCGVFAAVAMALTAALISTTDPLQAERNRQLALVAAALSGSLAGFLRFNRFPARVFMGDTGALPLGGVLALLAVMLRCEMLLLVFGSIFAAELASVALQVAWFRGTGRRIFRCAPLHHHFQFLGWPEATIVRRFWATAGSFVLVGLLLVTSASTPRLWNGVARTPFCNLQFTICNLQWSPTPANTALPKGPR
jgi:phospho-N-acetylmuramoyl-pentapeptide-transferase